MLRRQKTKYLLLFTLLLSMSLFLAGCQTTADNSLTVNNPQTGQTNGPVKPADSTGQPGNSGVTSPAAPVSEKPMLKIFYLDVGQADSILIQAPGGKTVLIDAGNNDDGAKVVAYLKKQSIKRLDIVIGTHPHEDHIGGLDTVIKAFEIGQVVMPKKDTTTESYKDVVAAVAQKGLKITEAKAGLNLDLGAGITAQMIAPNSSGYEDINDYSTVFKLAYGKNTFLFEGDAEKISEREMLAKGYNLQADVLKVGHHGSNSSSDPLFLAKVSPAYAIISVGKDNSYGLPKQETLDKLSAVNSKIYRTDVTGTIIVKSDGQNIIIETEKGQGGK